ncbi:alpha/beta hydrolase [Pseudoclavibacter helvolus]|uniref:alpha/beta hydrolase n=1 Tax=Pseudoclavibacter helvolus TaxID=255205 RepID=UPI003C74D019
MRTRYWLPVGFAITVAGVTTLLARAITRVTPTRRREELLAVDQNKITFASTHTTRLPGRYAVIDPDSGAHAQLGAVIHDDGKRVTRELENTTGRFTPGPVRWSGVYHSTPGQVGQHRTVEIAATSGILDGWIFNERAKSSTWAVHIHGQGATLHSALRGVPACTRAGLTSLVAPYYGDRRAAADPHRTTFGALEGRDVHAGIEFARRAGASHVVLVGWSLGAHVALGLAQATNLPVRALVLIDPPLDWRGVLEHYRRRGRFIPRPLFAAALALIQAPILHRAAGIPVPVPLHRNYLDLPMETSIPVLAITSDGDRDVPTMQLEHFARLNTSVRVERFPHVPHTMEWNRDAERWDSIVAEFCVSHSRPVAD